MTERRRYRTKQQEVILDCLKRQEGRFLTADQFMDCLRAEGLSVGQTTVYRGLERLAEEGDVMKLPSPDGTKIRYCYAGRESLHCPGKLVCLGCGRFIPLECSRLDGFLTHIYEEHGFAPDRGNMVFYGYCSDCQAAGAGRTRR